MLDSELGPLIGESYNRAYGVGLIVRTQMLAELDEIVEYKQSLDQPRQQEHLQKTWMTRLQGCQRTVEVWQRILKIRTLVLSPTEDKEMWIKFANLCRKSSRLNISNKTLLSLLSTPSKDLLQLDIVRNDPRVVYACLKHVWDAGDRENAFFQIKGFTKHLVDKLGLSTLSDINSKIESSRGDPEKLKLVKLLARCYLKVGDWQVALQDDWNAVSGLLM